MHSHCVGLQDPIRKTSLTRQISSVWGLTEVRDDSEQFWVEGKVWSGQIHRLSQVGLVDPVRHANGVEIVTGDSGLCSGFLEWLTVWRIQPVEPNKAQVPDQPVRVFRLRPLHEASPLLGFGVLTKQCTYGVSNTP